MVSRQKDRGSIRNLAGIEFRFEKTRGSASPFFRRRENYHRVRE